MVRKPSEMQSEIRQRMRDGNGEVEIVHIFRKEELKGKTRLFAKLRLGKDCSIGYHEHANEEEIFYVTAGEGIVTEDGKSHLRWRRVGTSSTRATSCHTTRTSRAGSRVI